MTVFDDAVKIHAICIDNSLTEYDARILTYIHSKSIESKKGINYFLESETIDHENDKQAILILLGKNHDDDQFAYIEQKLDENAKKLFQLISSKIKQVDIQLQQTMGLENRLTSELNSRLRLYTDVNFRKSMVAIYTKLIVPQLMEYSNDRIKKAFNEYTTRQKKINEELFNDLNS